MRAKALFKARLLECADCHQIVARNGPAQRYCVSCSSHRDISRKQAWSAKHKRGPARPAVRIARASAMVQAGAERSLENRLGPFWITEQEQQFQFLQVVRVVVPFDYAASKNAIWRTGRGGHVYARKEAIGIRENLAAHIHMTHAAWVEAKIWIDIFVEKPNHRGDAINVVDLVCDAVKDATGVDDRWYSIRRLDWAIVKREPRIYVGICQEASEPQRVCSYCGRILPLLSFSKNRSGPGGFSRQCADCGKLKHARSLL